MPILSHFPSFFSLSPYKPFSNQQQYRLSLPTQEHPLRNHFTISACSIKKSRGSRKVKRNAELCKEIQEFLSEVGLPKGHVPSLKELSQHGRNDLANIVRRRGYKLIKELLTNSTETNIDGFETDKCLAEKQDAASDHEDRLTDQENKVRYMVEDLSLSTEKPLMGNNLGSSNIGPDFSTFDLNRVPSANSSLEERVPYDLKGHDEKVNHMLEDESLSSEASIMDNNSGSLSVDPNLNSHALSCMLVESSAKSSLEENTFYNVKGDDEEVNNMAKEISVSPDVSVVQNISSSLNIDPALKYDDNSFMSMEFSNNSSLEENVAKFIQDGHLDTIEGVLSESSAEDSKRLFESENAIEIQSPAEERSEYVTSRGNGDMRLNEGTLTAVMTQPVRDDHSSAEGFIGANLDKDSDVETIERENQAQISHLKIMLHQKELELSQLKELIEMEKLALAVLQTKAETEVGKAQKLISEKDEELHAAEESLLGLEEVEIQYCGDGEIVEVAGSFNGWYHRIKMDLQPSSKILGPIGSRKSKFWSTVLWLYPGTYEIKFIVDGQWRIDPEKESVTRGTICNNILQVD